MSNIQSHSFGGSKSLVIRTANRSPSSKEPEVLNIDHVFCIDVSGSMSGELPKLREHLKNKIVKMVQPGDTLSIVWFSGRGQHGTLLTEQALKGLLDVQEVHELIDRYLNPVGMTGFKEPLEDCGKVWKKLRESRPNALSSLLFMSDGCDNQWSHQEIFDALDSIYGKFQASTFVEYGFYADRKLLSAMAEKMGGSVVLSADFPSFAPVVEHALTASPSRAFAKIEAPGCKDFVFGVSPSGDLLTFAVDNGQAVVPVDPETKEPSLDLYWISDSVVGNRGEPLSYDPQPDTVLKAASAALSAYGFRMRGDIVKPLLLEVRDADLLRSFSTCFGKQRYSSFAEEAMLKAWQGSVARVAPESVKRYFRTDLPTMIDLLDLLMDVDAVAMLDNAMFKYDRISRKTEAVDGSLKFKADASVGYPINGFVLNEERANISMRLKKTGVLDLDVQDRPAGLPKEIRAYQWRNFALVADGVVHVDLLPIRLTSAQYDELKKHPLYTAFNDLGVFANLTVAVDGTVDMVLNLMNVGLTNEAMASQPSGQALLFKELKLLEHRAEQRVYNHYLKLQSKGEADESLSTLLGFEGAKWLAEKGYKGGLFQPKTERAASTDVYKGVELKTAIKSFNSLPKVEEILERKKKGKSLTPSMELLAPIVEKVEEASRTMNVKEFEAFVEGMAKLATTRARAALADVARHKFGILMGQTWFSEATTAGELSMKVPYKGRDYECTVKLVDTDIEV